MPVQLTCENSACRKALRVRDELAGKRIKCPACSQVMTVPAAPQAVARSRAREPEPDPLQGVWELVGNEKDGEPGSARVITALGQTLTISGTRFEVTLFEGRSKAKGDFIEEARNHGTLRIDATLDPSEMDLCWQSGTLAGQTKKAIYRIDGDRLTVCIAHGGGKRPRHFKTAKGDELSIDVYRRR